MAKPEARAGARDTSLRVSSQVRDSLKAAAAVMGRALYDVTNEALMQYLAGLRLGDPLVAVRRKPEKPLAAQARDGRGHPGETGQG